MRSRIVLLGLLALGAWSPRGVSAQSDLETLAARCMTLAVVSDLRCTEVAVAARAAQANVGLLAGLGSEVPGSSSTLGRRLAGTPRVSVSARSALLQAGMPSLVDRANEPYAEGSFVIPLLEGSATVGVFDGVRLMPTVGGFLSLDVFARLGFLFPPKGEGFEGGVAAGSFGARIGVVRESFTLPGVSFSVARRVMGTVAVGSTELGDPGSVELRPNVTSLRFTVSKDLYAVGVMGGVGWDGYGGAATLSVSDGITERSVGTGHFDSSRRVYFGGLSMTFLVLQISGEVGWGQAMGAVSGYRGAPYDPASGTLFGGLAFRLTI